MTSKEIKDLYEMLERNYKLAIEERYKNLYPILSVEELKLIIDLLKTIL